MDHMEIGSGILQMLIAKIIKKAINNKIGKQVGLDFVFNGPITFDVIPQTKEAVLSLSCTAKLPIDDLNILIDKFM